MIHFDQVSVTYADAPRPTLAGVDLTVPEGELCLVVGHTGSGKSTLLGTVNGLVPHFTGGTLAGRVRVAGRDTATHPPRELADVVGMVGQDPTAGFVTDTVEEELAYAMESLGLPGDLMRRRVEETLDLLGLADLRARALSTLSGGQRQRVAIGSVLTAHPAVLVLDEPTSALDPPAAEEVLATLQRLVHDLGITVLLAEHRLERVLQYADRLLHLDGKGGVEMGTPAEVMRHADIAPPVIALGRLAGWTPLPLTVRDARRRARPLREALTSRHEPAVSPPGDTATPGPAGRAACVASVHDLAVHYDRVIALQGVNLELHAGEIVALMGRNGSGKSTLLRALTGLNAADAGVARVMDRDPRKLNARELIARVGFVPQQPADLLYAETIEAECQASDADAGVTQGTCQRLLEQLVPGLDPCVHPRDLSEGQRLGLVLALILTAAPPVLLLDEPTRGLDYAAKDRLVTVLRELAAAGHAVVIATHDVELAAAVSNRTVVLADGDIVVNGPTHEIVIGSPAFAPQVAKILAPLPYLTVEQVADRLQSLGHATAPGASGTPS